MQFFNLLKKPKYLVTKNKIQKVTDNQIKAMEEGQVLDILSPSVTQNYTSTSTHINKNNYNTYIKQIETINQMYNNRTDYGGELLRMLILSRVSFIAGEGLSVKAQNKTTEKCVTSFLKYNKLLDGSELLKLVQTTQMEGKILYELFSQEENVKVIRYSYYITPYIIQENKRNKELYEKAKISTDKLSETTISNLKTGSGDINLNSDKFVYIKIGGSPDRINNTPPLIANILTDIENFSRCKYDMRNNNHLFGRITPIYLVDELKEAKALQAIINSIDSTIGRAYAGTAKEVFYLEPSGKGQEVLAKEMIELMRIISSNQGIPLQLLAYPDLLSNRATAENMLEMINASTNQERLLIEEGITEMVQKAMVIGFEKGIEGYINAPDGFEIKLNFATLALLKQIAEVWLPLFLEEIISKKSLMSRLPGINVEKEIQLLKKEKDERMKNAKEMFQNNNLPNQEKEDEDNDDENRKDKQ